MNSIDLNYAFRNKIGLLNDRSYFYFLCFTTLVYNIGSIFNSTGLTTLSFFALSLLCVVSTINQLTYTLYFFTPMYLYLVIGTFPLYNVIILLLLLKRLLDCDFHLNVLFSFLLISVISIEVIHLIASGTVPTFNTIKLFLIIFLIGLHLFETPRGYSNALGIRFLGAGTFLYAATFLWLNQNIVVTDSFRFGGLGELDPNTYGLYNLLAIALIAQNLLIKRNRKFSYFSGLMIIGVVLIAGALTLSKTYFLTSIGITVVFLIATLNNKKQFFVSMTILSLGGFLLSRSAYVVTTIEKILYRFEIGRRAGDITTGRTFIYNNYMEYLHDHIQTVIFGEGMYSYMNNFEIRPHNTIIELIMSWGIVGGIVFICLFIAGASKYRMRFEEPESIKLLSFIPLMLLLIYSQSLTLLYQEATYVYIVISVMAILGNSEVAESHELQMNKAADSPVILRNQYR